MIRSIKLITQRLADAAVEGSQRRKEFAGREENRAGGAPQAEQALTMLAENIEADGHGATVRPEDLVTCDGNPALLTVPGRGAPLDGP